MTFVVTGACIGCKYTDCVAICPMDCFVEGPNFLVIDPAGCIDCSICVPECPVGAIVGDRELEGEDRQWIARNRELAQAPGWQPIRLARPPLPGHARWAGVEDKLHLLDTGPLER